jgi:hypothetical protein
LRLVKVWSPNLMPSYRAQRPEVTAHGARDVCALLDRETIIQEAGWVVPTIIKFVG